jgi:hypothetical protein
MGRPSTTHITGSIYYDVSFEDFFLHARRSQEVFLIKTHHPPIDDSPAIFVTRDGRSSIVSYAHFLKEIEGFDASLTALIESKAGIGGWSQILDDWNPLKRPRTLMLRFEDVLVAPHRITELISDFLLREPVQNWENPFRQLKNIDPKRFRVGGNQENLRELTKEAEELFWQYHRPWMERLGYCDISPGFRSAMTSRLDVQPDEWIGRAQTVNDVYTVPRDEDSRRTTLRDGETVYRRLFEKERQLAELQQKLVEKEAVIQRLQQRGGGKRRRAG